MILFGQRALERALPPRQRWLARKIQAQARGWSGPQPDPKVPDALIRGFERVREPMRASSKRRDLRK